MSPRRPTTREWRNFGHYGLTRVHRNLRPAAVAWLCVVIFTLLLLILLHVI